MSRIVPVYYFWVDRSSDRAWEQVTEVLVHADSIPPYFIMDASGGGTEQFKLDKHNLGMAVVLPDEDKVGDEPRVIWEWAYVRKRSEVSPLSPTQVAALEGLIQHEQYLLIQQQLKAYKFAQDDFVDAFKYSINAKPKIAPVQRCSACKSLLYNSRCINHSCALYHK